MAFSCADMRALLLIGYSSDLMAQIRLLGRILAEFASILSVIAMFLGFFAWFGESAKLVEEGGEGVMYHVGT